ncbi:hypothetical protein SPAB_05332 [Salmonella enterica subsp. enterica serovar Paratyphi B str. SPB7]|uniref:Uncharacterized protein n=1 Tax=Salmonella paratyphi B (strain ATCC BAA-1250 / SPB7) TaxID=1016998 RepID=A0A6C6ZA04_SALPB|nr:hypothetical protein SPAB_05332 [Salmonella enterica subsp. enterica serovar Paratyphi B str. SPB7]
MKWLFNIQVKKQDAVLALSSTHTELTAADNRTILVLPANSILFNFSPRLFFICVPD